jgi:nucleoside-diphosphate-sugar epimerase
MAVLVTGAGGFVGGALVTDLLRSGREVRAVDRKPLDEWFVSEASADNQVLDLRDLEACRVATQGCEEVYNLAADMGGMGFIETHKADCMLSVLISTHMLVAAKDAGVRRFFYSSSACVYAEQHQTDPAVTALVETDAYPAMPEDGYGWEKLFGERMARHFLEDFGLETRVARYHNVYGPNGTYDGGREKAPAAVCRKVAQAVHSGDHRIEIWGDGKQTRSFTYIDDCVYGTQLIMAGDSPEPVNLGSSELVSIDDLVTIVEEIAGVTLTRTYNLDAPQGVRGRNSDNTLIKARYGWEPTTTLRSGLKATYEWIHEQLGTTS